MNHVHHTTAVPRLVLGQRVGDYEVLGRIACSGQACIYIIRPWIESAFWRTMTRIWLLSWRRLGGFSVRHVERYQLGVLKLAHQSFQANLHDEHEYLSKSDSDATHKHLVAIYSRRFQVSTRRRLRDVALVELPTTDGQRATFAYITLAYEAGGSVAELLSRRSHRPLRPDQAAWIALQTAWALDHLHERLKLIHHDIKPQNLLLRSRPTFWIPQRPHIVLVDFGAAESLVSPRLRSIYGTKDYLPPERLKALPDSISVQIDIYSLGMVLYEMLTGPLERQTTAALADCSRQLQTPHERNSTISSALSELVMAAITRDVEKRKQLLPSMSTFVARLNQTPEIQKSGRIRAPLHFIHILQAAVVVIGLLLLLTQPFPPSISATGTLTPTTGITPLYATLSPPPPTPLPTRTATPTVHPTSTRAPRNTALVTPVTVTP